MIIMSVVLLTEQSHSPCYRTEATASQIDYDRETGAIDNGLQDNRPIFYCM